MALRCDRELVRIMFRNGTQAALHPTLERIAAAMLILYVVAFTFRRFSRQAAWAMGATLVNAVMYL